MLAAQQIVMFMRHGVRVVGLASLMAHALGWYCSGTRFARRRISAVSSSGSSPPYARPTSTTNGLPR